MPEQRIRKAAQAMLARHLRRRCREIPAQELFRSAAVFAPHPDDECLGCGGTILRLRDADVPVRLVFLTDGGRSHPNLITPEWLAAQRRGEALAAARVLGVPAEAVHFIGIGDGHLEHHRDTATQRILDIFHHHRTDQVFLPYRGDQPRDHYFTNRAVHAALAALDYAPQVREYPIWFWNHWPWTRFWRHGSAPPLRRIAQRVRRPAHALQSLYLLFRDFRYAVDVLKELPRKRAALACHRSQMTRLQPDANWVTLADVAEGDWLACFFTGAEFFHSPRRQR